MKSCTIFVLNKILEREKTTVRKWISGQIWAYATCRVITDQRSVHWWYACKRGCSSRLSWPLHEPLQRNQLSSAYLTSCSPVCLSVCPAASRPSANWWRRASQTATQRSASISNNASVFTSSARLNALTAQINSRPCFKFIPSSVVGRPRRHAVRPLGNPFRRLTTLIFSVAATPKIDCRRSGTAVARWGECVPTQRSPPPAPPHPPVGRLDG